MVGTGTSDFMEYDGYSVNSDAFVDDTSRRLCYKPWVSSICFGVFFIMDYNDITYYKANVYSNNGSIG